MNRRSPVDPSVILLKGVGTWDAIAVAVAGMAPTMSMSLNPQEPAEHVGRVVPLVFAVSTFVVLMVAWCFARLARHHPNAGSAYGFVAAILGARAGLVAGWTLLGTYLCFAVVGIGAVGLFGANLMQRLNLWHEASSFALTVVAAAVVAPLSIIPARRAGLVLIILEGIAVVAMLLLAGAVLVLVAQGHGPQGDPPLRDLFIPTAGVGASAIAMGLSFGLLSFAGFEQVATLGEEVKESRFTIPHVLIGTVVGAGVVFTLVSAAETLGFGTDPDGVGRFTKSTSLLRISQRAFSEAGRETLSMGWPSAPPWEALWRRSWRPRASSLRFAGICFLRAL
jgi:amino acid transporter